jgi:hypothetical protein
VNDLTLSFYFSASDVQTMDYAAYYSSVDEFQIYQSFSGIEVGDIEVSRTATNYTTMLAFDQGGKSYIFVSTPTHYVNTTTSLKTVDGDIALTPDDGSVVCIVASNGDLFISYAYVEDDEPLVTVALDPGVAIDECAIASTNNGVLALAVRSGDDFYIGFAKYP